MSEPLSRKRPAILVAITAPSHDLRSIAVGIDDATVVVMEGPVDIDSLEFETRVKIARIAEITGQSRGQVVSRAVEELFRQVMATATDEELASKQTNYRKQ